MTAGDLSRELGIREREVHPHLTHIARTLASNGEKLAIVPAECLSCGFVFKERRRFTRPGRCPRCRGSRIQTPAYRITS
ncbi:MAG: transcriptional regulator [Desulfobacterales bacterium]|nr:transcriptional regulator [Desulfobacterales bacterium]